MVPYMLLPIHLNRKNLEKIPFFASTLNIGRVDKDLIIFKSINLISSTLSNDPDVPWHMAFALL